MAIQQMFLGAGGPPPAEPLGSIPVTSSLLWYHDAFYVTDNGSQVTQWTDQSGNGRHQTTSGGRMGNNIQQGESKKGERNLTKSRKYIYTTNTANGMRWNGSGWWPGNSYTLMHICARDPSNTDGRIFDGFTENWLSGFHGSNEGVFHHANWVTTTNRDSRNNFIVSIDRLNRTRSKGYNHSGSSYDSGYQTGAGTNSPTTNQGIGLGCGQYSGDINSAGGESCKWECIMAACWSNSKSDGDCNTLMNWGYDALYG